ncbi:hypothetical protein CMI49_01280 [Candidatus Pacearchaeota archaeon]|nr:hypothetical protein [Candidatus Pacearchaeota archaeon]
MMKGNKNNMKNNKKLSGLQKLGVAGAFVAGISGGLINKVYAKENPLREDIKKVERFVRENYTSNGTQMFNGKPTDFFEYKGKNFEVNVNDFGVLIKSMYKNSERILYDSRENKLGTLDSLTLVEGHPNKSEQLQLELEAYARNNPQMIKTHMEMENMMIRGAKLGPKQKLSTNRTLFKRGEDNSIWGYDFSKQELFKDKRFLPKLQNILAQEVNYIKKKVLKK